MTIMPGQCTNPALNGLFTTGGGILQEKARNIF
jgi:hypothetical protein